MQSWNMSTSDLLKLSPEETTHILVLLLNKLGLQVQQNSGYGETIFEIVEKTDG